MKLRSVLVVLFGAVKGAFFYFVYTPTPEKPALSGELEEKTIVVGEREKSYLTYQPDALVNDPGVILVLHGSQGTAEQVRRSVAYEFDQLADARKIRDRVFTQPRP
jgi:polyhydroxybutyrate depolymerase